MFESRPCINCNSTPDQHEPVLHTVVSHRCHLEGSPLTVVACRRCGLVFLNPAPSSDSILRLYRDDLYQKRKKPIAPAARPPKPTKNNLYDFLVEALGRPPSNISVLDIGAQRGQWLARFDASNDRQGIELSPMADHPCDPSIRLHRMALADADLARQFDLVTATALIEHLFDPLAGLLQMNEMTAPGGHLFLYTPDVHALGVQRGVSRYFKIVHSYYFSVATLSSLLIKAGFQIVATKQFPLIAAPSVFAPGQQAVGNLAILARKVGEPTLEEALAHRPSTDANEADRAIASIRTARKRDRTLAFIATLYETKVGRLLRRFTSQTAA